VGDRDEINEIYETRGLDEVWRWAKGHPLRWKTLRDWAKAKQERAERELSESRAARDAASDDLHRLSDDAADVSERLADNKKKLEQAESQRDQGQVEELRKVRDGLQKRVAELKRRIESNETQHKGAIVKAHDAKEAEKAWIERKIIYRKRWEAAKKRFAEAGHVEWEDWMASGHDARVTDFVKDAMAWGVIGFDLVVTSLRRDFVPPGGSTTSYHLSGQAGDIAGEKMSAYQSAVYKRYDGKPACLELFGPQNAVCLKNGSPLTLVEGSALETLHDTHVHVAG